jgi:glucosamine--fructose-6-phosphate aminotransferase (isomerizing)
LINLKSRHWFDRSSLCAASSARFLPAISSPILVQGLQRLEYRGYDSCGVAVHAQGLTRARSTSRVAELLEQVQADQLEGVTGIAHTRWATHGVPAVRNAHPHFSHGPGTAEWADTRPGRIALVHNGIIENHDQLRAQLQAKGYHFSSQTDTEVIAHLVDSLYDGDLFEAVKTAIRQLQGAYAIAVLCKDEPNRVVGARAGSPLILGVGKDGQENFLASDAMALAGVTDQIVYLEEGDMVDLQLGKYWIVDKAHKAVQRKVQTVQAHSGAAELGPYRHYMQKESSSNPAQLPTRSKAWKASSPSCLKRPITMRRVKVLFTHSRRSTMY